MYIFGIYFYFFVFLLVPMALLSFMVGLYLVFSPNQDTRESAPDALFRLPLLLYGFIWGIGAATLLWDVIPFFPFLFPMLGLCGGALFAHNISESAEDKIEDGQAVTAELMRVLLIVIVSILIFIPFAFFRTFSQ